MGLNQNKTNGTIICDLCYKDDATFRKVGSLVYFRTHEADVRLEIIPLGLWKTGEEWLIGNFMPSDKVPDAPFIDGDVYARTEKRGERIKIGHIHTRDDEEGKAQYYMTLFGIPIGEWRRIMREEPDGTRKALYLPVEME